MHMTCRRTLAWDSTRSFYPAEKMIFPRTLFPMGSRPTIHIPVKHTLDSRSPCLKTPREHISMESEYIGCLATILVRLKRTQTRVPQVELSLKASELLTDSLHTDNFLLTWLQTNNQTYLIR